MPDKKKYFCGYSKRGLGGKVGLSAKNYRIITGALPDTVTRDRRDLLKKMGAEINREK